MKNLLRFILILFYSSQTLQAQDAIRAKIIDSTTQKPIAFATVELNKNSGIISNENGVFQMYLNRKTTVNDTLFINCLGYETKRIAVQKLTDSLIVLSEKSIALDEVLLSNKNYSVEEILEKISENLINNYDFNFTKSRLFYRASYTTNIHKKDVELKKSSIPEFNQAFTDSVLQIIPKTSDYYIEILGDLFHPNALDKAHKLHIVKASKLYDKNNEITFNGLEKKLNAILKKRVKRDSYFKIKSGFLLGTKLDIDSTAFSNPEEDEALKKNQAMLEAEKKKAQEEQEDFLNYRKKALVRLKNNSFINEDSPLNFLEKSNRYNFELLDHLFLNGNFVYKITFTPKRKEDFKGVIYVNTDDFAIIRVDYENVKLLKNFKLFGVSFKRHLEKGTLIYSKNNMNKYGLKYAEAEKGNTFEIKRPLKVIEKNKHTKGRRKQNEISTQINFITSNLSKQELVVFENENITETTFTNFTEKANIKPTYLPQYDPKFWEGYQVIEPNQAIKDFKSMEE